jgi:hypothetical protein
MKCKQHSHSVRLGRRLIAAALSAALFVQPVAGLTAAPVAAAAEAAAANVQKPSLSLIREEMITSGAKLKTYQWKSVRSGKEAKANMYVIEVDLSNPYVRLDVMTGQNGKFTKRNSVLGMAQETGAVAGINGDYFNTSLEGAPLGPQISAGELMSTPSELTGMYAFALTKNRVPMIDLFTFQGSVTAADGTAYPLAGINKAAYMTEPDKRYSHVDALYIYTSAWAQVERPKNSSTTPTEVLVQNDTVVRISEKASLAMLPPEDGYILRAHGKAADFVLQHLKPGDRVSASYLLQSAVTGKPFDPAEFETMIGGHTILVNEGKPVANFSRSVDSLGGYRSRTGLGYSKDGRYVYLITVSGYGDSQGMSLREFQEAMTMAGVWKGLNLDGGGSTTMVTRPLGETSATLTHPTDYGTQQRLVVNGLGVYTTAPKGEPKGIAISGETMLLIGERATYQIKGYDQYYNPIEISAGNTKWSISEPIGTIKDGVFTATKAGKTTITAQTGTAKQSIKVEVAGRDQIRRMSIDTGELALEAGATYTLPVSVELKDGRKRKVPANSINWEIIGFDGKMDGDTLTIRSVRDNRTGYVIARYDGFSAMAVLKPSVEKQWETFENVKYPVQFAGLPAETTGSAQVVYGLPGAENTNALYLTYDFTNGTGNRFAYAVLNGSGLAIDGKPQGMSLRVMGDNSFNWLRAEFIDANNQIIYVTLADRINWMGWKTISVDLAGYNPAYPLKLRRLYVVHEEQYSDEHAAVGEVAFDNIAFRYGDSSAEPSRPRIELTLNNPKVKADGRTITLDAAPFEIKGTTYVPLRFVVSALGGMVTWDSKEKKVSILRGSTFQEMWIGSKELLVNGRRLTAPGEPIIRNGRTMVPLRFISEQFGLNVTWRPKTKSIMIQ